MSETRCHSTLNIQKRKQNYEEKMVWCICLWSNNADPKSSHLHSQLHSNKDKNTSQISQCTRNKHNRYAETQQDFLNKCFSTFFSLFHLPTLMHNSFINLTICMLHYNPRHVSSINMPIFRRTNCIIAASGIIALCKWP
jgi:hypothetical protein